MSGMWKDLRYAARMLRKSPGTSAVAVLALGLGIGLTTIMFSIVYGGVWKGLPFEKSGNLLHVERNNLSRDIESMEVTLHDFLDYREQQTSFEGLAAFYTGTINLAGSERPERYDGGFISANAFDLIRVQPILGRDFRDGEDSPAADPVMLLGYHVWQDRFDGDPNVVGQVARVNGEQTTIIGVMPEGFRFPVVEDVWVPLRLDPLEIERGEGMTLEVFGRLRDGVSRDEAAAELQAIAGRLAEAYPETNEGVGAAVKPYIEEFIGAEPRAMLYTMLGAVFLVLLVACANVANLLLSRAATRSKELAIRSAVGASRFRVMLQLVGEGLVLAAAGALLGLAISLVGIELFNRALAPTDPPFWIQIGLHPLVLIFVIALTALAGVLSGILPAIQASGNAVNEVLKDESWGSSGFRVGRLSKALVVGEIALSLGVLVAAGLMIKSVINLKTIDLGFQTEATFTARMGLFEADYPDTTSRREFYREVLRRVSERPGVEAAAIVTALPGAWSYGGQFGIEGEIYDRDQDYPIARWAVASPDFLDVYGVQVLEGRSFDGRDTHDALPVAIVNRSFAEHFFPEGAALGKRIRQGASDSEQPWRTIVGVVPDMYMQGLSNLEEDGWGVYFPLDQYDTRFAYVALRAAGSEPMSLAGGARDDVMAVDPDIPLYWVQTHQAAIEEQTWFFRVFGNLFTVFGVAALFLAAVGLYGVMSASVSSRTAEMGIRMALGAQGQDVLRLVLRQGAVQVGIGMALGLALAALLSRGLEIILFQVEPWDPAVFALIAAVLAAVGMLASYIPARRATRVDPAVALRYE
ncbi:MAG: ABC transporter permease [Gemmatimonadota bacterium]|nr:MAG: ABC transporter permease [Gemmatimonadota bacterium]